MARLPKTFTDDQESEIRRRSLNGESLTTIAHLLSVGRKTIENAVKRAGGGRARTGSYTFTTDTCLELRQRLENGETMLDMAVELNVERSTISRAVKSVGGQPRVGPPIRVKSYNRNDGYTVLKIEPGDPYYLMGRSVPGLSLGRTVLEHRLVMARKLGRALKRNETVHHKDGDRKNNHPDNLELWIGRQPKGASHAHCSTCHCFDGVPESARHLTTEETADPDCF